MEFIDTHSHIAWHVDDGIQNIEDARIALTMAASDGIHTILSTPHVIPGRTDKNNYLKISSRQDELKQLGQEFDVDIFKGGEVMLNSHFLDTLREGWLPKIHNGPYILVEYNVRYDFAFQNLDFDPLFELSVAGYHPVIAHVERYFHKKLDMDVINDWADNDYVFQINATSLLGLDSKQSKKNAWWLIENGYAHTVATDTHRTTGYRIENLSAAYEQVCRKVGKKAADLLFYENPKNVILGRPVTDIPVHKKKSFFSFGR
ncbi:tyrosine-protein phosphatase [Ileibacterium valens]|uniref:protein-tyrosine-phosphatase n=1 Tax=Ileibacterium valens TaxID=1862668 RepID=A0A1U7NIX5_9FIRM|nr:CpsB/CapC family capsule biosynthesis tyrosine phosphatase [Ileibacterium valens]OLU41556.1 hypothetical protein BM735_03985 [Erysipelotrichaceae bacterium NYU-BL-F16]OLU42601.1 hypothetical protein BO222_01335 [Ileibacterium valens]OLU43226.1 hypothetical protein BO224_00575 [Erysipelotrichaceae bacterium NYU-BL-E8]